MSFIDWNSPNFNTQATIPSDSLPLDLSAVGIGTVNTFDSSKPSGGTFADPLSGLFTGSSPAPVASGSSVTASATGGAAPSSGGPSVAVGGIEGWFLRGTVIVLGFIFVGVGLAMFRNPNTTVVNVLKSGVAKAA